MNAKNLKTLVVVAVMTAFTAVSAQAGQTSIVVGDTVQISALGLPDLEKKAVVNQDGEISYPILGSLEAAGLTTAELRAHLITQLNVAGLARDPKIGVEIVARPPFYVTGDVIKPGMQPYVFNVTVRSAVALAGGLDPLGARGAHNVVINPADIRSQYETSAIEFVREQTRLRRLEAELNNQTTVKFDVYPDLPVTPDLVAKENELQLRDFKLRLERQQNEKASLEKQVAQVQAVLAALEERRKAEEESIKQQNEEVTNVKSLADRGIVIQGRFLDSQRAMLMLKSRLFEVISTQAQTSRALLEAQRKLQAVDEDRKLIATKELQEVYAAVSTLQARIVGLRQQMNIKTTTTAPNFAIYRQQNGSRLKLDVDENAPVLPGDIVEVAFGVSTAVPVQ
jgi:polysaccharide biosynthesis/export protein